MNYGGQEWVNVIQMTIISTTVGKNPLEEIAFRENRRVQNAVLGYNLKSDGMSLGRFQANHSTSS